MKFPQNGGTLVILNQRTFMVSARSDVNSRSFLSMAFRGDQELAEVKHISRHAAFLGGLRSPDVYICLSWGLLYISDCCVTES